jgi:phosphate/sulfate permease
LWSGLFNFLGVLTSSGAVAFGIIALLPVELILQVGSSAGFAMVFALLIAAIIWNLGTWWLGLPASSSHTLVGSIIGVGVANALVHGRDGTSGVDWGQAVKVGESLLLSPLVGFVFSLLLLLALRQLVRKPELYEAPCGNRPPPWWVRGVLMLTCTGVSFAHGSNDGQKGMGLIMLILVGTVPISYALNRAMPSDQVTQFAAVAHVTQESLSKLAAGEAPADPRAVLSEYVRTKSAKPELLPALVAVTASIGEQVQQHSSLRQVPAASVANVRNDMYLASEAIRFAQKDASLHFDADTKANLTAFKKQIDAATKFIPLWVKVVGSRIGFPSTWSSPPSCSTPSGLPGSGSRAEQPRDTGGLAVIGAETDILLEQWGDRLFRRRRPSDGLPIPAMRAVAVRREVRAVVRREPQVMVKVTGGGRGMGPIKAHMAYISKRGSLEVEDQEGERHKGREAINELAWEWRYAGTRIPEVSHRREAFNIILSMPRKTEAAVVLAGSPCV